MEAQDPRDADEFGNGLGEVEGLEDLGNTDPVDSSSDDFQNADEIAASVDAAPEEEGPAPERKARLAFEGGTLKLPLIGQLLEIMDVVEFAAGHWRGAKRMIEHGCDESVGEVEVKLSSFEGMTLSLALNIVGFFAPHMGEDAANLLRRLKEQHDAIELTEEQREQAAVAFQAIVDEDEAEMMGCSVEEWREIKAAALKEQEIELDSHPQAPGGSNLN